ncbi:MAG: hypothetical protein ACREOQ_17510 [Gemmatimonadales bacterium]
MTGPITINVSGASDPEKVGQVVLREFRLRARAQSGDTLHHSRLV